MVVVASVDRWCVVTPGLGVTDAVEQMIAECLALTQHLAEQSTTADGAKQCCVCGDRAIVLVAPGWGGVWACRACDDDAKAAAS